jgi:adenylylsulfate kinase
MAAHDENVVWHPHPVTVAAARTAPRPSRVVLWFTGLSGSGKSTVAGRWKRRCISGREHLPAGWR